MTQTFVDLAGIDYTLPTPPALTDPPLTLLDLSLTLINTEDLVEQLRVAVEDAASAQATLEAIPTQGDRPSEADDIEDAGSTLEQMQAEWDDRAHAINDAMDAVRAADAFASDMAAQVAALSRWEQGFQYLPELSNAAAMEVFVAGGGATKRTGSNQPLFYWYDPFTVVARDDRSAFGWPAASYAERAARATRALRNHDSWQVENEFWSGAQIPTNYHLSASPNTPMTTPGRREMTVPWPNPSAAPGTVLGTAVALGASLSALDQAIASSDAGTGMIHASPFVVQMWMKLFNYIRDSNGFVYTVNHNLIVPGYGYPGTGPDAADRTVADAVTNATAEVTSATAAFTAADVGRPVSGDDIPAGAVVGQVVSGTQIMIWAADADGVYGPIDATGSNPAGSLTVTGRGGRADFAPQQWAYATERTYTCLGDLNVYPDHLNQQSPLLTVDNSIDVRVEQNAAVITNRLLRAAVLVDTTTT